MADNKKILSGSQGVHIGESDDDYSLTPTLDESLEWDGASVETPALQPQPVKQSGASRPPDEKGNSNLLKGILAGAAILLLLLILGWQLGLFGGSEQAASIAAASGAQAASVPAPAPANQPPVDPPPAPPVEPSAAAAPERQSDATPLKEKTQNENELRNEEVNAPDVQKPETKETKEKQSGEALPDDVATWKKEHYYLARQLNDPKLLEAVSHLGENFRGNAPAAQGLIDLLKRLPPPEASSDGAATRKPEEYTRLVGTIVAALGQNGSDVARAALEKILSGLFATDDDTMAVEVALETLAAHSCEENEAILLRAATAPETLRPAERQGAWPARDLRLRAVDLIKPVASVGFRLKLAEIVAGHVGRFDPDDPVRNFLIASDPMNCGAQTLIHENSSTPKEIRDRLEKYLTDYGSHTMSYWLGLLEKAPEEVVASAPPENQQPSALDALRERERKMQEELARERERVQNNQSEADRQRAQQAQAEAERERIRKAQEEADREKTRNAQAARKTPGDKGVSAADQTRRMQVASAEAMRKAKEQGERQRMIADRTQRAAVEREREDALRQSRDDEIRILRNLKEADEKAQRQHEANRSKEEAAREPSRQQASVNPARPQPTPNTPASSGQSPLEGFLFVQRPEKALMPNLELWLSSQLWSERFRAAVDPQVEKLTSLDKQSQLVLLASTIPHDSTRAALAHAFKKNWKDGPQTLEADGWIDRLTTDPGLLVLVKMNPRKSPQAVRAPAGRPGPGMEVVELPPESAAGRSPNSRAAKAAEARKLAEQKKEQEEQAKLDWMSVSSKLVQSWCQRLHDVALIREKKAAVAGHPLGEASPKLPENFELSPSSKVVAAYHSTWPDQLPSEWSEAKPSFLEVHYLRIEETNSKLKRTIAFYQRQANAKTPNIRTVGNSLWMDILRPSAHKERQKSLDVLISRVDKVPVELDSAKNDEETDVIIELLSIEIKDPTEK